MRMATPSEEAQAPTPREAAMAAYQRARRAPSDQSRQSELLDGIFHLLASIDGGIRGQAAA
jgi:hypothetical protein